jgi:flavin-dependent dehydrogenase
LASSETARPDGRASGAHPLALDVLVVGGGPAGCATALRLVRAGLRVAIIEKTHYDAPRVGETLSPGTRALLAHLGVWHDFERAGHLVAYGNAASWGSAVREERDFLFTPYGHGWHLDRRRFDADLAAAAERAGATVWRGAGIAELARAPGGWQVVVRRPDSPVAVSARMLVDATGKAQALASRLGGCRRRCDRMVALHAAFPASGPNADTFTLVEPVECGWFYSASLPAGQGAAGSDRVWWVALMTDADLCRHYALRSPTVWARLLSGASQTTERLGTHPLPPQIGVATAHSARLERLHGDGWIAVGDAAASHDPLSSSGIARALDSGIRTATAIAALLSRGGAAADRAALDALDALETRHELDFARYLATRAQYYTMEQRWPNSAFWRRRQREITLDPACRLMAMHDAGSPTRWPAEFEPLDPASLVAACREARSAADIVATHAQREQIGDTRIILGLQWLLQARVLGVAGRSIR